MTRLGFPCAGPTVSLVLSVCLRRLLTVEPLVRTNLQPRPREVGRARRTLATLLQQWGIRGDGADIAILLTSELVTNAIRHGKGPVVMEARLSGGRLRVEISDADVTVIRAEPASLESVQGRGLYLVDALADTWGADHAVTGKKVWFELAQR